MAVRRNSNIRSLFSEADLEASNPFDELLPFSQPVQATVSQPPQLNYQDIIAQANQAGFMPYAGDGPMTSNVGNLEINPWFGDTTGGTEQGGEQPQQAGYTISTPLGGGLYRTDVVDMAGNLQRSNIHDPSADKYGLQDMAKLAAVALGANFLPGILGAGEAAGSLTAGITPEAIAAAEAALPTALSSAPLTTSLAAPLAELTSGGLLTETGAPALLSEQAISALPTASSTVTPSLTEGITTADIAASEAGLPSSGLLSPGNIKDIVKLLTSLSATGLLGGGGGGGQQRAFVPPTATVPTGNEDYYNAVQQYYNTYMPTAPRDVSTPLQQWYQGKFGG